MKAITLHPTASGGGSQQQYEQNYNDSRDRRSSTTHNPDYPASNTAGGTSAGQGTAGGIAGIGNIDATVNHYELPNLAQRNNINF